MYSVHPFECKWEQMHANLVIKHLKSEAATSQSITCYIISRSIFSTLIKYHRAKKKCFAKISNGQICEAWKSHLVYMLNIHFPKCFLKISLKVYLQYNSMPMVPCPSIPTNSTSFLYLALSWRPIVLQTFFWLDQNGLMD